MKPKLEFAAVFAAGWFVSTCVCHSQIPDIVTQPTDVTVELGGTATFSVVASGPGPLTYQWTYQWNNIYYFLTGETNSSLVFTNVTYEQAGTYAVTVQNPSGSVGSSNATLRVNDAPGTVNLLARTNVLATRPVSIPVYLTAGGTENKLSMSIAADPGKYLSFVSVQPGADAPGAEIVVDTSRITSSPALYLGFTVALPNGSTFHQGTREVAVLSFRTTAVKGNTPIGVSQGDSPVRRQLTDAAGNALPFYSRSGSFIGILATNDVEGNVYPRSNPDVRVDGNDWTLIGQFGLGMYSPVDGVEFQRADCAPLSTGGDGVISLADWVQVARYITGLDFVPTEAGPTNAVSGVGPGPSGGPSCGVRLTDALMLQGESLPISVVMDAQGGENALACTVAFDADLLRFQGASKGPVASDGWLLVNTNLAGSGKLALAVELPTGGGLAPGAYDLVHLQFGASLNKTGSTAISVNDLLARSEVCDARANIISATWSAGTVSVVSPPALSVERRGEAVALRWPLWGTNFVVQASSQPTTTNWSDVNATRVMDNTQLAVVLPLTNSSIFYRLRKQ